MAKSYRITRGGLHEKYINSRRKIQFLGGGFGNGKTSAVCNKTLMIAKDYPGANILVARATYPKLNDTIRKAFIEDWCPKDWIKRKPTKDDNTLILKNGTVINFRYISQRGKTSEDGSTTSNLLSANYDLIVVDQIEDPEIGYKDFTDLMGRLRGTARYMGDDPTMPATGPRWMLLTANPAMNWVYSKLIRPLHKFRDGIVTDDLIIDEATKEPLIELFEGSTYENKHNLAADFIQGLESTYKGQMRDRFLLGQWAAYEGLVYPSFDQRVHVVEHDSLVLHLYKRNADLRRHFSVMLKPISGYDYGIASPACFLFGATDPDGILYLFDGFYLKETTVSDQAEEMSRIRREYQNLYTVQNMFEYPPVMADPAIFKRTSDIGETVSSRFAKAGIGMRRGMNGQAAGIQKVLELLAIDENLYNPFMQCEGCPRLMISSRLDWMIDEIGGYYWKKNPFGESTDVPVDRNDHALDTLRYIVTSMPKIQDLRQMRRQSPGWMSWHERDAQEQVSYRHG